MGFYTIKISGTIRSLKDYFFKTYASKRIGCRRGGLVGP